MTLICAVNNGTCTLNVPGGQPLTHALQKSEDAKVTVLVDEPTPDYTVQVEAEASVAQIVEGRIEATGTGGTTTGVDVPPGNYSVTWWHTVPKEFQRHHRAELYKTVGPVGRVMGLIGCLPVVGAITMLFAIGAVIELFTQRPEQLWPASAYLLGIPTFMVLVPLLVFKLRPFVEAQTKVRAFWDTMPDLFLRLERIGDG